MNYPYVKDISVEIAAEVDSGAIVDFLSEPNIDGSFVPPLSDEVRKLSISDRVDRKMQSGVWLLAGYAGRTVGSMAIVPGSLPDTVESSAGSGISEGIDTPGWSSSKIWEVSTFVVSKEVKEGTRVKGIGSALLKRAKTWVSDGDNNDRLIVDSWIGGELDGFLKAFNKKELEHPGEVPLDTLLRIYTDIKKRGANGPPTTVYGVPSSEGDIQFFADRQQEVAKLRGTYERIYGDLGLAA